MAGQVKGQVIDTMTEEEYLPLWQTNPAGSYVFGVRHAYEELLREVAAHDGCYPAYHMNKKYWISIALDDSMTDDEIWPLLEGSHTFAAQGKKNRSAGTAAAGRCSVAQSSAMPTGKVLTDTLAQEVLAVVAQIPAGKVATYGQIARMIGRPKNARLVGKILSRAEYYGTYPCHRVVNHAGRLAPGFAAQKERLQAEGVTFKDEFHVSMSQCQWR